MVVVAHTLVMVYQMIALNVAINSYDHALLTLLVSNQFVEIKGSVFKKFEKDNLFQIMCAGTLFRVFFGTKKTFVDESIQISLSDSRLHSCSSSSRFVTLLSSAALHLISRAGSSFRAALASGGAITLFGRFLRCIRFALCTCQQICLHPYIACVDGPGLGNDGGLA
jgi:hypothetical protein